ncbi:MAG: VOC family protein [Pseudomonadota bacterium]|nr:VOC family protein [Pseudomonadota bacterium]
MYDHLGLKVKSLDASVRFYAAVLAPLGCELCTQDASSAGFGPRGEPSFWLYGSAREGGAGTHIAFRAQDREAVKRFHAAGLKAGGSNNGTAGVRADYSPAYYAAFVIDPDGNNVEAVCMKENT